jgi:hypothetical protein
MRVARLLPVLLLAGCETPADPPVMHVPPDTFPSLCVDPATGCYAVSRLTPFTLARLTADAGPDGVIPLEKSGFRMVVTSGSLPEAERPPVLGTCRLDGEVLRFTPRFPLSPGLSYAVRFSHAGTAPVSATFSIPKPVLTPTVEVTHVYPSADVLPENLLKFYVHFSGPMGQGEAYKHVRLTDNATGKKVEGAFLEIGEEMWDPAGVRLTLLLDPGRIKRGLKPREELGPILEAGKTYTLVIDATFPDATGAPLRRGTVKTFKAGPADETQPDPKTWKLEPPAAGSSAALVVRSPEALDHALFGRVLTVLGPDGGKVAGGAVVSGGETVWGFTPSRPWQAGKYQLTVAHELEDLVGNRVDRPFEVDELRPITATLPMDKTALPFEVR